MTVVCRLCLQRHSRHYLPFLTMSSNVKDSVGMFGNYYSRRLKAYLNTRHSFRLETVEEI
jgi:hypothetical protein